MSGGGPLLVSRQEKSQDSCPAFLGSVGGTDKWADLGT